MPPKLDPMPTTSFHLLHEVNACESRYKHLATALGGINEYGKDAPITLLQILDANGIEDALWALRACPGCDRFARLLACDFAEHVLPLFETKYPNDMRPRNAIKVARQFANGEATKEELAAAWDAAWVAERIWQEQTLRTKLMEIQNAPQT